MDLILMFLFNFLLYSTSFTANIERKSSRGELQQRNSSEISAKVDILNEDFQYAIFDNSDLNGMLQFAKDPRISDFVTKHIFPVKYRNYEFYIQTEFDQFDLQGNEYAMAKRMEIVGHNFIIDVIKQFGESIQQLGFYRSDQVFDDRLAEICQYINAYCSESLTYFNLGTIKENMLAQFKKPFTKLEKLNLHIDTNRIGSLQSLNNIFPKVKSLRVDYYTLPTNNPVNGNQFDGNRFIESEMPHMKHLENVDIISYMNTNQSNYAIVERQLAKMFENNPQIQNLLYVLELSDNIMQAINRHLPNLEHFRITTLYPNIQPIHLEHVKYLSVHSEYASPFERLTFAHLDTVSMFYSSKHEAGSARNSWLTFFKNHPNLRQFNCTILKDDGFVEFLADLKNLNVIHITRFPSFDIDLIGRLIENHTNLMKLEYMVYAFNRPEYSDLTIYHERFGNEWNISYVYNDWPTIAFERKN